MGAANLGMILDKEIMRGIIFDYNSVNPGSGMRGNRYQGRIPYRIGYFQTQARQLTSSAFERKKSF